MVGVIASMCSAAGDAAIFAIIVSASIGKPLSLGDSTMTSDMSPWNRSFSLVLNPAMTLFTTTSVATPSITLTMQTNAKKRVRR
jgi:hypothetical protein